MVSDLNYLVGVRSPLRKYVSKEKTLILNVNKVSIINLKHQEMEELYRLIIYIYRVQRCHNKVIESDFSFYESCFLFHEGTVC